MTDENVLRLAVQTFRGTANLALVSALVKQRVPAVGLSGIDGSTLTLRKRPPVDVGGKMVDFGFVGDAVNVNADLILSLIEADYVPALCSLGADMDGQVLNINADTMACELAVGLNAEKLIFITDKPGILHDQKDESSIYSVLDAKDIERLKSEGVISGGMLPKVTAALGALKRGVSRVHILGADEDDALLEETFTNQGCGTMITLSREAE
ncbi:MAG: acetylglutamate kinase [Planctomycetaceae bacterium]|nr:acetylglutamate kinase [Planctomycetaceae bacterium]